MARSTSTSTSFAYAAKFYTEAGVPVTPCIGKRPCLKGCTVQGASFDEIKKFARSNPGADLRLALVGLGDKIVVLQDTCGDNTPSPDCLPEGFPPAPRWEAHGSYFWLYKYHPLLDGYKKSVLDLWGTATLRVRKCVTILPLDAQSLLDQIRKLGKPSLPDRFIADAIENAKPARYSYQDNDDEDYEDYSDLEGEDCDE